MKHVIVCLTIALLSCSAWAQITIGQGNAPTAGTDVTSYSASTVTYSPSSGSNQNWNITSFTYNPFDSYSYVSPVGTPFASTFPTATLCGDAHGSYSYYRVANNGLYLLGFAVLVDTLEIIQIAETEALAVPFPCTMGTQWTSVFHYEIELFPGFSTGSKDSSLHVVDGWGTMTTPSWTAPALRSESHSYYQAYLNGVPQGPPTEGWDYEWFTQDGARNVSYYNSEATGPDFTEGDLSYSSSGTIDVDPTRGPVAESFALSQNYPNPFNPTTTLPIEMAKSGKVEITIYNEVGQIVHHMSQDLTAGSHALPIDGSAWSTGSYFAKVMAGNESQTARMVLVK